MPTMFAAVHVIVGLSTRAEYRCMQCGKSPTFSRINLSLYFHIARLHISRLHIAKALVITTVWGGPLPANTCFRIPHFVRILWFMNVAVFARDLPAGAEFFADCNLVDVNRESR